MDKWMYLSTAYSLLEFYELGVNEAAYGREPTTVH